MAITQNHVINIQPGVSAPLVIHCSQGDTGSVINLTVVNGDETFDCSSYVCSVHGVRSDGANWGPYEVTVSGSTVSFSLRQEMTAIAGPCLAEITIGTVGTANFAILVENATFSLGVTYTEDVSLYQSILNYIMGAVQDIKTEATASVNKAIDQMNTNTSALNAKYDTAIDQMNTNTSALNAKYDTAITNFNQGIATTQNQYAVTNAKLDTAISAATQDSEVQDIRVKADGTSATTAGNAVREQITDLKSALNAIGNRGAKIIMFETLENTDDGVTKWFNHIAPFSANEKNVYAMVYQVSNVQNDIPYLVRVNINFTNETFAEAARLTELNTPVRVMWDTTKTPQDISIVCNRADGSATSPTRVTSKWGILIYSLGTQQQQLIESVSHSNILINDTLVANTSESTKWFVSFIPETVRRFCIRIGDVKGRIGTPDHIARVQVNYTDGSVALAGYVDELNKTVVIESNAKKTVEQWSLIVYTAEENQSVHFKTEWYTTVWEEEEEEEAFPSSVVANLLFNTDAANLHGTFYGPVSKEYAAKTTSENQQPASYVRIEDIPTNGKKYAYAIILSRHGLGLRSGMVAFFDSMDATEVTTNYINIDPEVYDNGPCIKQINIPSGTVKILAEFEGISNATTVGTPSVIGETYYVRGCYVYLTNELIDESSKSLTTQWYEAIDNIRKAQGTGLCFGIQTDTHFALTHPLYVGKQLKEMTKYVGFDFIANLGDITRGYEGANFPDNPDNMRAYAKEIMKRYTDGVECPFFVSIGNHESNVLWGNDHPSEPKFTLSELYAQYTKQVINTSAKIVAKPGKSYFYADLVPARIIVLFTNDSETGGFTVSNEQVAWFTDEALSTNKPVLVLSHVPLVNGWNPDNLNYSADYAKIITPLETFKNNGGTVIACIYGHAHRQESQNVNGIWHILCTRTESQFETAEFFMVDLDTFNITTIGIGAAQSRTFEH